MKKIVALIIYLFTGCFIFAQEMNCISGRYTDDIFPEFSISTVQYGQNTNALQQNQNLLMDIYMPIDDDQVERPLIIAAHGGSFVLGSRQDMDVFCERLVKQGFVCATIDYRLWPALFLGFPDSARLSRTAIGAMSDMKAAVRFFRQSYIEGNPYGIDTNYIAVGGGSAGAITAIHVGFFDESDPISTVLRDEIELQGGFEGNSGDESNLSFSSKVHSVYNLSGAIFDTAYIDEDDVPIFSIQGTADEVVPYGIGKAANLVTMMGSQLIHQRATNLGIANELVSVEGGGHANIYSEEIYTSDLDNYNGIIGNYWSEILCGITSSFYSELPVFEARVFPNPAYHQATIDLGIDQEIRAFELYNAQGQSSRVNHRINNGQIHVPYPGSKGLYIAKIRTETSIYQAKILFN